MPVARKKKVRDKRVKELRGSFRQRNGFYVYRLTIAKGLRKDFSLGTQDYDEAIRQAQILDSQYEAPNKQSAIEKMSAIKGFSKIAENLLLQDVWPIYSIHPNRAMPATVAERESYRTTYEEFVNFAKTPSSQPDGTKHIAVFHIKDVSPQLSEAFSAYMKTCPIGVSTHNRKIMRLRKIFTFFGTCLR